MQINIKNQLQFIYHIEAINYNSEMLYYSHLYLYALVLIICSIVVFILLLSIV